METDFDIDTIPSTDRIKITVEDLHTKNNVTVFVDNYSTDIESLSYASNTAFNQAYKTLMEGNMNGETKKADDQDQDLKHQKPEESDNLQKSESPDSEYMKDRGLNRETHGKE